MAPSCKKQKLNQKRGNCQGRSDRGEGKEPSHDPIIKRVVVEDTFKKEEFVVGPTLQRGGVCGGLNI